MECKKVRITEVGQMFFPGLSRNIVAQVAMPFFIFDAKLQQFTVVYSFEDLKKAFVIKKNIDHLKTDFL
jgi:hypothetical protein